MARSGITTGLAIVVAVAALAGCSRTDAPQLMNLRNSGTGPDEFAVLPGKPLKMPADLSALPAPTPGLPNRTDPTPRADAVAALGGDPRRVPAGASLAGRGVSATDGGLLAHAGRFGVAPDIRPTLAAEDLKYRRDNDGRLLERLFNVNVYFKAYRPQALDQHAELQRWRARGVRTVGSPPPGPGQ